MQGNRSLLASGKDSLPVAKTAHRKKAQALLEFPCIVVLPGYEELWKPHHDKHGRDAVTDNWGASKGHNETRQMTSECVCQQDGRLGL